MNLGFDVILTFSSSVVVAGFVVTGGVDFSSIDFVAGSVSSAVDDGMSEVDGIDFGCFGRAIGLSDSDFLVATRFGGSGDDFGLEPPVADRRGGGGGVRVEVVDVVETFLSGGPTRFAPGLRGRAGGGGVLVAEFDDAADNFLSGGPVRFAPGRRGGALPDDAADVVDIFLSAGPVRCAAGRREGGAVRGAEVSAVVDAAAFGSDDVADVVVVAVFGGFFFKTFFFLAGPDEAPPGAPKGFCHVSLTPIKFPSSSNDSCDACFFFFAAARASANATDFSFGFAVPAGAGLSDSVLVGVPDAARCNDAKFGALSLIDERLTSPPAVFLTTVTTFFFDFLLLSSA